MGEREDEAEVLAAVVAAWRAGQISSWRRFTSAQMADQDRLGALVRLHQSGLIVADLLRGDGGYIAAVPIDVTVAGVGEADARP